MFPLDSPLVNIPRDADRKLVVADTIRPDFDPDGRLLTIEILDASSTCRARI
jgi:hypothetical protein